MSNMMHQVVPQHRNVEDGVDHFMDNVEFGNLYDILRQHYRIMEFTPNFLQDMFCFAKGKTAHAQVQKADVLDLTLLFLFIYIGKKEAAVLMKTLYLDLKAIYEREQSYAQNFVRVCRIIFCRPEMFQALVAST